MREIKLRARHKLDGKWFYGTNGELKVNDETTMCLSMFWHLVEVGELDAETVGQYTDSKDKNGKEIYEGDLPARHFGTRLVTWYCGAWWLMLLDGKNDKPLFGNTQFREVIGNIYEGLYSGEECDIIKEWKKNTNEQSHTPSQDTRLAEKPEGKLD